MPLVQASPQLRTQESGASSILALTSNVTAGSALLLVIGNYPSGISSVTDNQGNTWQRAVQVGDAGINFGEIWYALNCAAGSTTLTITPTSTSGNYLTGWAVEWSGMQTTAALDRTGTGENALSASTSAATQQAEELALTVSIADFGASALGWGTPAGYTLIGREGDSNNYTGIQAAYRVLSASGVETATHTAGFAGSSFDTAIATFRLATGAVQLAGAAVAGASGAGVLSKSVPVHGAALAGAVINGGLSVGVNLAGSAVAAAAASAGVTQAVSLAGLASASAQAVASVTLQVTLTSAALASAQASGGLSKQVPLSGSAVAAAAAAGAFTGSAALTGAAIAGGEGGALLTLQVPLTGGALAAAAAGASLQVGADLDGEAIARALAGAALTVQAYVLLEGAAQASASGGGALDGSVQYSRAPSGPGFVLGRILPTSRPADTGASRPSKAGGGRPIIPSARRWTR